MSAAPYDLVVLGGGNAYRVAAKCGAAGQRVALIEEGPLGGTCPHRGCIPSKLMLGSARVAQAVRNAGRFHVDAELSGVDGVAMVADAMGYTASTDARFEKGLPETVTLFRGHGRFVGDRELVVGDQRITGRRVLLATGSRPRQLGGPWSGLPYWTSDEVFRLTALPDSLTVVGGGLVGCELATFFAEAGVPTTLVQRGPHVLGREDADLRERAADVLDEVLDLRTDTEVAGVEHDDRLGFRLELRAEGEAAVHESAAVLLAVGRVPGTTDIGLETTSIRTDDEGHVTVDEHLRTTAEGVWALGDVHGRHPFTHAASHEAHHLVRVFTGETDEPPDLWPMPHAVFLDPPLAAVGATEDELRERGVPHVVARRDVADTVFGHAVGDHHGLAKLIVDPGGEILGAHFLGHAAPEWLHEVAAVLKWRPSVTSLVDLIHVHPASSEVVRDVAREAWSRVRGRSAS